MILVDTSAWIEFFRGRGPIADRVDQALDENDVAICGPIQTELHRGLRSKSERAHVLLYLGGCVLLPQPAQLWEEAGELGFALGRRGFSVKTLDLLIASYALAHSAAILTTDRDFSLMRRAGVPLLLA